MRPETLAALVALRNVLLLSILVVGIFFRYKLTLVGWIGVWSCWTLYAAISFLASPSLAVRGCLVIMALGLALNIVAIAANGGKMPYDHSSAPRGIWVRIDETTRLRFLCDIHGGMSIGDFVIAAAMLAGCVCSVFFILRSSR